MAAPCPIAGPYPRNPQTLHNYLRGAAGNESAEAFRGGFPRWNRGWNPRWISPCVFFVRFVRGVGPKKNSRRNPPRIPPPKSAVKSVGQSAARIRHDTAGNSTPCTPGIAITTRRTSGRDQLSGQQCAPCIVAYMRTRSQPDRLKC